jgi:uncharacterized membrane protein
MAELNLMMRLRSFFGFAIAGIAFVFVSGLFLTMLAMALQTETSEGGLTSITNLTSAFVNLEPLGIIIGLIAFVVLGFLVWVFGIIGVAIRKAIGVDENRPNLTFGKRPALLGFFLAGVITVVIFAGLSAVLNGITQDPTLDLTNIMTLFDAVVTFNPLLIVGALIGLAIIGFLIIKIAEIEKPILTDKAPDSITPDSN